MTSKAVRLEARDLTVGYRVGPTTRVVLADLDLVVEAGSLVCVLGRNGSGKSTLLRSLAGLEKPLAGDVALDGSSIGRLSPRARARRLGVVLPEAVHPGLLRVHELVALGRHPHTGWSGRFGDDDRRAVADALAQVDATALATRRVASLSDGERQRVSIARALAQEPGILVLDEPTAFLDLPTRAEVMALLLDLAHGPAGRAIVLSTHDLDLALRHADRLWLLDGDALLDGGPEDLVLDGSVERAFGRPGLVFDGDRGTFRATIRPTRTMAIHHVDVSEHWVRWTRRALERAACAVVEHEASAPGLTVVGVAEENGRPMWWLEGREESRYRHLSALLRRIEELDLSG